MKLSLFSLFLFSFSLLNCQNVDKRNYEKALKECINEKAVKQTNAVLILDTTQKKPYTLSNFDFFDTIQNFERDLINEKLLKSKSKEAYQELLRNLEDEKEYRKKYDRLKRNNKFLFYASKDMGIYSFLYSECPKKIYKQTKSKELLNVLNRYDNFELHGGPTIRDLKELTTISDFEKNEVVRLSTANAIFLYMLRSHKKNNHPDLEEKDGLFYSKDSLSKKNK